MACNPTRQNCTPASVFAGVASSECSQFLNPINFQAEQLIYNTAFGDLINNFGIPVDYYINTYNLSAADNLYGEQPTAIFYGPISLMMYIELNENAINLSKFGFASDDELTGYVHIQTFEETMSGKDFFVRTQQGNILSYEDYITYMQTQSAENIITDLLFDIVTENSETGGFDLIGGDYEAINKYTNNGQAVEPKSGDLIQISPLGCDRPNGRGAKIFEVTERTDQDVSSMNPLLGHYVYRLRAKRYEYSFEPGAPKELQNQQVFENSFSGILSSNIPGVVPSEEKSYPGDIDVTSQNTVFNMNANNTDIYGSYY
jgi:hypothetical protein